ncbi:cupin domain-containing protein [Frankia sp. AgB32]|uniref:cupin domain-containing protein n=1 Tax=Frankia sp. AgB32 TaxID=631119 RepID=UPI0020108A77|nr:cupin domain-containing protein [Frankia sp. AgB32]MCK9897840.1 cupin domain-containing protein [Frankia sp. AgB32]
MISVGDPLKLALAAGPADGSPTSVFFEIWEPGGGQPANSHADSTEIFVFLSGVGRAYSDEHVVDVGPGDVLILPPGSVHRIVNTSPSQRLYSVTIMAVDAGALPGGFAALVSDGTSAGFDEVDLATLTRARHD